MITTKRHHYLPQFYIKGFVNSDNKIHVFDKVEKCFKKHEFSTQQIFFEWNRNTLLINGEKDDFIEKFYGKFENIIAPTYNKIKNQSYRINYNPKDIFNLLLLVSLTHWRLPINDEEAKKFVMSTPSKKLFIKIINKETEKEVREEFYEELKTRNGFIEMYKLSKSFIDFGNLDMNKNFDNWKIYGAATDVQLHILGDNPIVFKQQPENKNILETELIFPLSKGITLYHNKGKVIYELKPEDRVKVDVMVFLQSQRFVVGPNREYLNMIKNLAEQYNSESRVEILRKEIFNTFE